MKPTDFAIRTLLVRLDKENRADLAVRLRADLATGTISAAALRLVAEESGRLGTETKVAFNRAIDLLEGGAHREVLLDALFWCLNPTSFDAFQLRVERFFEQDRILAGSVASPTTVERHRFALLRGGPKLAVDVAQGDLASARLWFIGHYPRNVDEAVALARLSRPPDGEVTISPTEPVDASYLERQAQHARDELAAQQRFEVVGTGDEILYWDKEMCAVWHRAVSPLRPTPLPTSRPGGFKLPAAYTDLDMVLGGRNTGIRENLRSCTSCVRSTGRRGTRMRIRAIGGIKTYRRRKGLGNRCTGARADAEEGESHGEA